MNQKWEYVERNAQQGRITVWYLAHDRRDVSLWDFTTGQFPAQG